METRLISQQMQHLNQVNFKMVGCLPVDCSGEGRKRKGGLCILWDEEVDFDLITFSTNHILGRITSKGQHDSWIFSGVYGWPENTNKWRSWALMEQIKRDGNEAWMCCGDFNEIFWSHEKSVGSIRSIHQMNLFRETAAKCLLRDLSFAGNKFTWSNGRKGEENIQERLDRAMANDNWRDIFPEHQVRHLCRVCSDHAPILVCFDTKVADEDKRGRRCRRFRFENMWLQHPQLESVIKDTWQERTWGCNFQEKVKTCGQVLMELDRHEFGHIRTKINKLKEKLDKAQQENQSEDTMNKIRILEDELNQCLKVEEILWSQRSRALWLKEGDKNSKFFHEKTTHRRKRNTIKKIRNNDGVTVTKRKDIEKVILDHFQTTFKSDGCKETETALEAINAKVTEHMNEKSLKAI